MISLTRRFFLGIAISSRIINLVVEALIPSKPRHCHRPSTLSPEYAITPKQLLSRIEHSNIDSLVRSRSEARWQGNYTKADELRGMIDDIAVGISWRTILQGTNSTFDKEDSLSGNVDSLQYFKVVITDFPRSDGGGSSWELEGQVTNNNEPTENEDNLLQLAHAALGLAVSKSEQGRDVNENDLNHLITRAHDRLKVLKSRKRIANFLPGRGMTELHGRKAADAALWFALSGASFDSKSLNLYEELVDMAKEELLRFGSNNSCRAKDILHIVERIAMAGIVGSSSKQLYEVAADFLETKNNAHDTQRWDDVEDGEHENSIDYSNIVQSLRDSSFGLHSHRPLLGLWRFSTRQRKQKAFFQHAVRHYDGSFSDGQGMCHTNISTQQDQYTWSECFADPTRPLVIDIGKILIVVDAWLSKNRFNSNILCLFKAVAWEFHY